MSKGERTRQAILRAALELFREHGYDATTMRTVAERAGVSVGNAYYYFASKDTLLQAFYREVHDAHKVAAQTVLASEKNLSARLLGVMLAKLDVIEPYHRFSALMFRNAADPRSPLNPFHPAGDTIRREGEALFAEVVNGGRPKPPANLAADLPALLWTYSMGIVLYWIHDHSDNRAQTRAFVERTVDLVGNMVRIAGNPLLRPLRRKALSLFRDLLPLKAP